MARIRSMKPEFRTSLTVSGWKRDIRLTWALLWGYLDDHGRGVDAPKLIAADCFPLDDDVTEKKMDSWLGIIEQSGPLCRYEVDGKRLLHAVNWDEHQKPSHPTRSKLAPCPRHEREEFAYWSRVRAEWLAKTSGDPPEEFANLSGDPPESLANGSGEIRERFVPEQGSKGARELGNARPKERATRTPDTFAVDEGLADWAAAKGLRFDLAAETERFLDYHRSKDSAFSNWRAAWRNWMARVTDFRPKQATAGDDVPEWLDA